MKPLEISNINALMHLNAIYSVHYLKYNRFIFPEKIYTWVAITTFLFKNKLADDIIIFMFEHVELEKTWVIKINTLPY